MHKHKTWFPFIVVALTVVLALAIVSLFKERIQETVQPTAQEAPPINAIEYQAEVHAIVGSLRGDLGTEASVVVDQLDSARSAVLDLVVPGVYRDMHLEMVVVLSKWIEDLEAGGEVSVPERWDQLVDQYPWIE